VHFSTEVHGAICAANPSLASPIDAAVKAGIPWKTILMWIVENGPSLVDKIGELIRLFKIEHPTTETTA
jgi:hypothetical protein